MCVALGKEDRRDMNLRSGAWRQGQWPFGFQPAVFESVPGDQGHSPLRAVVLVHLESGVAGENLPATRSSAGSVNQTGALPVLVTKMGGESFLHQVARTGREARVLKPGIMQMVAGPSIVWTQGAWLVTGEPNVARAIFAGLAALVTGCPRALGMATPLAAMRGVGPERYPSALGRGIPAFKNVKKVVLASASLWFLPVSYSAASTH